MFDVTGGTIVHVYRGVDSFSKMICHCVRQFQHLFGHDLSLFFCNLFFAASSKVQSARAIGEN